MASKDEAELLARFGAAVRRARERAGLTQEALATDADVSRPTVARIERGDHSVTLRVVARLAAALGVEPRRLV